MTKEKARSGGSSRGKLQQPFYPKSPPVSSAMENFFSLK
jgi:hypothetical protein